MKIIMTAIVLTLSLNFLSACANKKKEEAGVTPTPTPQEVKAQAETGKTKAAPADALTCTSGKDSRTLEVSTVGRGCELKYGKHGNTETVATSGSSIEHCQKIADRIRGKLEASGFQCK